jgi:phosphohistidine phosphatase
MDIFLLRHGVAVERGTPGYNHDADRPLTDEGERKLRDIVQAMRRLGLEFDLILSSPYTRARQTAEIAADGLKLRKKLEFSETLIPEGGTEELIELLKRRRPKPDSVLLVGHEPYLSELISLLVAGERGFPVVMKKGGLAKLEVDSLAPGRCAMLAWLLTPGQMRLMA